MDGWGVDGWKDWGWMDLKTGRDILLDAEGLLKEESYGAVLVVQSVF